MALEIVATPGDANANSFGTLEEAEVYFDSRLHTTVWDAAISTNKKKALVMSARVLNLIGQAYKTLVKAGSATYVDTPYYLTRPTWTGEPATTTQALSWPRTGMYDANGNAIPSNVIPQDLKNAQFELALLLLPADRTLENSIAAQGITSIKAGPVALTFKEMIETRVVPDSVFNLMPSSWFTEPVIEYVSGNSALFGMV